MNTETSFGIFDLFIFLGVFQGILLSWFFIKNSTIKNRANFYQGFLLLFLSLGIFEELLNNTGYIVQFLPVSDYSEPLNFTFGPLVFLYIRSCLYDKPQKFEWLHFVLAGFWIIYMVFYWSQPNEVKYNSYVLTKHPDWELLSYEFTYSDDPLGIRHFVNEGLGAHFLVYIVLGFIMLRRKFKELNQNFLTTNNKMLVQIRNLIIHFIIIIIIFFATKFYFGMKSDIGGYFLASYISFTIFATSYQVLNRSDFFQQNQSFLSFPMVKYKKSSLEEEDKIRIEKQIIDKFENEKYFSNNLASLSDLSKQIRESSHHVSQVINEKMGKSFFELLAWYRVEEAKRILLNKDEAGITIEELAEKVGYNSKSSFNSVFKKHTSYTPSEFRKLNKQA